EGRATAAAVLGPGHPGRSTIGTALGQGRAAFQQEARVPRGWRSAVRTTLHSPPALVAQEPVQDARSDRSPVVGCRTHVVDRVDLRRESVGGVVGRLLPR